MKRESSNAPIVLPRTGDWGRDSREVVSCPIHRHYHCEDWATGICEMDPASLNPLPWSTYVGISEAELERERAVTDHHSSSVPPPPPWTSLNIEDSTLEYPSLRSSIWRIAENVGHGMRATDNDNDNDNDTTHWKGGRAGVGIMDQMMLSLTLRPRKWKPLEPEDRQKKRMWCDIRE
ncbi:hypothetical protein BO99DRAFT_261008 [Aspergillus violaceofuscus CBS 115571]|uniref:Uncharacterized protein n=1 Tax=Aspergillus violaceofuscus (strain CBS 115571) TaxID=1450538 RepID=A0A2V5H2W6_ASPV1|nr:hypothetical protein BO99DRAFT_261008 [Aspergillus violaceofuscus CBS 115571]